MAILSRQVVMKNMLSGRCLWSSVQTMPHVLVKRLNSGLIHNFVERRNGKS